ncbi:hypothetical protein EN854_34295, partial [Mesorhizobium sp. M4B.F.Ca.ET.211.01.1.1]
VPKGGCGRPLELYASLFEKKTGILLSGDIIYDGPLIDDVYHSLVDDYVATLLSVRGLDVPVVHGGHFPSFGKVRYRQLIDEYLPQMAARLPLLRQ